MLAWNPSWLYGPVRLVNFVSFSLSNTRTGYSLGGTSLPESQLAPYIQQAVDQVGPQFNTMFFPLAHLV